MSAKKPFLISIDVEGDNLWVRPREITCKNARYLPRFQSLCESCGFKPTYLTNYEMAKDPAFVDFARSAMGRGMAEIGMHLHAWHSPPAYKLTNDDYRAQPYLVEYPERVIRQKVEYMTNLLEDIFQTKMTSHRAGRWAIDHRYVKALVRLGYEVDCSVTPHVSWKRSRGAFQGGTDYRTFPAKPYLFQPGSIHPAHQAEGSDSLLEVPMSVVPRYKALGAIGPTDWLRPNGRNGKRLIPLANSIFVSDHPYAHFMLHSSELMPGGSSRFRSASSIDRLYANLEALFETASKMYVGQTLTEYRRSYASRSEAQPPIDCPAQSAGADRSYGPPARREAS